MKTMLALATALAATGTSTAAASPNAPVATYWGWTMVGYPSDAQGYRFTPDVLGGDGHPGRPAAGRAIVTGARPARVGAAPYRLVTDTLGPGGGLAPFRVSSRAGFSWPDAGVGAATSVGALLVIVGTTLLVARRRRVDL